MTNLRRLMLALVFLTCARALAADASYDTTRDYHSFANPAALSVEHADLALQVDFANKRFSGTIDLTVARHQPGAADLILDTRDLVIREVWLAGAGGDLRTTPFHLDSRDPILGSALHIDVSAATGERFTVRISYQTSPSATGLQWLAPEQTAGKRYQFVFSQSEAIHARSWLPLQDTPQVRMTYHARIFTPPEMVAVMSASQDPDQARDGDYSFDMPQPIPSYLLAVAVGDLEFRALGDRTGVYAEPATIEAAAYEFADTQSMLETCEKMFGPYRWGRYDLLILPPSFGLGGMENPRLTFATPTLIAGDRSLVNVIAHELSHSWSGNLVTNATWRDIWLNEGFTTFLERRVQEQLFGKRRGDMERVLGLAGLRRDLAELSPPAQVLAIDLRGKDPDDAFSLVPYEKGQLFLEYLQAKIGRERFDAFLRDYFEHFSFHSVTTEQFLGYLREKVLNAQPDLVSPASIEEWVYGPGLPKDAVLPSSDAFTQIDAERDEWLGGKKAVTALPAAEWSTQEWLHFLNGMPDKLTTAQLDELDATFHLTKSGNAEIAHSWLRNAIRNRYQPGLVRLEPYLMTIGRAKLIRPLYQDLMKTSWGRTEARRIYAQARPGYQAFTRTAIDPIVLGNGKRAGS